MTTTRTDIAEVSRIRRGPEADRLAQQVYDRLIAVVQRLSPQDWARPTDCTGWTVRDMVAHMVGAARAHASPIEFMRQGLQGQRRKAAFDGNDLDAMNAYQIEQQAHLSNDELVAALRELAPRAVRGRRRTPAPLRRLRLPLAASGSLAPGTPTSIQLGELLDVVLTRDVWLHRIDIARAIGEQPDVDTDADRRIVADIVAEWAARHSQPVQLQLTGPAGATYVQGTGGPTLTLDAVEFCRILSGRADGDGLLTTRVLF
ncbi:MAG: maleylpyruvate isomerase family mycothiol-dependent enzyme [Actinobacteria bacterium]|nr:maleylpyruvate isomerase family mycothiol-dependent enzyme [Actinomycetota bacterium]